MEPRRPARRIGRRITGLLLGLALPTAALAWLLGLDAVKKRINGAVWCPDADALDFDVVVRSSGSSTRFNDSLRCLDDDGLVTRTLGDLRMTMTTIGVAFAISVALLGLLVAGLWCSSRLVRRRPPL